MRFSRSAVVHCGLMLGVAMTASVALADELSSTPASLSPQAAAVKAADQHPVGSSTHAWLDLQSSNASAAPARPGGGEEASLVYHRYLDSFRHAIPSFFATSTGKGSGAASGTSN